MMPRSRPPTAHFVPRNSGFNASSHDTKNASASRWTMVGSGGDTVRPLPHKAGWSQNKIPFLTKILLVKRLAAALPFLALSCPAFLPPSWLHDSHRDLHKHCAVDVLALPQQQLPGLNCTSALPE